MAFVDHFGNERRVVPGRIPLALTPHRKGDRGDPLGTPGRQQFELLDLFALPDIVRSLGSGRRTLHAVRPFLISAAAWSCE